jgi:hypothetical protein
LTHASGSPLKDKSLRIPGQSTSEQLERALDDRIEAPGLTAALFIAFAVMERWRWYDRVGPI